MPVSHQADSLNLMEGTPNEVPDPSLENLEIFGDNILIRPFVPPKGLTTKSGGLIYLPDQVEADRAYLQVVGKVLAVGPGAYKDPNLKPGEKSYPFGWYGAPWVNVGDWVAYARHSGQKVMIRGVQCTLVKDTSILMKLERPEDIDINYNTIRFDSRK